jgi:hypothetical protein
MGSGDSRILHTQVSPRRWCRLAVDLEDFDPPAFSPSPGEAKISFALQLWATAAHKGPSRELIDAVVEMKRRNPYFGCRKIAEHL